MRKTFSLLFASALCLGFSVTSQAQSSTGHNFYKQSYASRNSGSFDKNSSLLTLGYGFPNVTTGGYWDNGFGPLYVKYEHGILNEVGIGGYLGFAASAHDGPGYKDNATAIGFGVLGYYHFNKLIPIKQLDVYAGVGIGFINGHYNYDAHSPFNRSDSYFDVNGIFKAGARWYFTPGFSVFLEAGYDGMSDANLGVSFRF